MWPALSQRRQSFLMGVFEICLMRGNRDLTRAQKSGILIVAHLI